MSTKLSVIEIPAKIAPSKPPRRGINLFRRGTDDFYQALYLRVHKDP